MKTREDLITILSMCRDYHEGYAKAEQVLWEIQKIACSNLNLWTCRFCKKVFHVGIAKESDYFGDKCLSCAARAELVCSK